MSAPWGWHLRGQVPAWSSGIPRKAAGLSVNRQQPKARSRSRTRETQPSSVSAPSVSQLEGPLALPGLRSDHPGRKGYTRGAFPSLDTEEHRAAAAADLITEMYSSSSRETIKKRLDFVYKALRPWNLQPFPPSQDTLLALGSTLKAGGYRSAASTLSTYKVACERAGHAFSAQLVRLKADVVRSCERGMGAPVKALALPFAQLGDLPSGDEPWVPLGPISPRTVVILSSWWLLREAEMSAARVCSLAFTNQRGKLVASWSLPASKTDQQALGVKRSHGCGCHGGASHPMCPAHLALEHVRRLQRWFPSSWAGNAPDRDLPFFPSKDGEACPKVAMVSTLVKAAEALGAPTRTPDGAERVSGHSARVTGAHGLAQAGLDTWAIQLLGRWGSDAVLGYIRDAPLLQASSWAAKALRGLPLGIVAASLPVCPSDLVCRAEAVAHGLQVGIPGQQVITLPVSDTAEALMDAAGASPNAGAPEVGSKVILNTSSGHWHAPQVHSLALPPASWRTFCGWKFGLVQHFQVESAIPPGMLHKKLCAFCFPAERQAQKESLAAWCSSIVPSADVVEAAISDASHAAPPCGPRNSPSISTRVGSASLVD